MKRLYLFFSAMLIVFAGKAQLFQQDFQSSTTPGSYISIANPSIGQFNELYDGGDFMAIDINTISGNNALRFSKSGTSIGGYTRTKDFLPEPKLMKFTFDIRVSNVTDDVTSAATWYFGENFQNGQAEPDAANVHSQFMIDFNEQQFGSEQFRFRRTGGGMGQTTSWYNISGNNMTTITFVVNNSGASVSYTGPNGSLETLGNDEWDLWVGNSLQFDDENNVTDAAKITDMKFLFNTGEGAIEMDNMEVVEINDFPSAFYQDFSSSTTVTDYDDNNPSNGQVNQIYDADNDNDMVISINTTGSNKLRFAKSVDGGGDATGSFARTTSFSGNLNTLMIQMDLTVSGNLNNNNSAAKFYVGEGFSTGSSTPGAGDINSYFEIDFQNGSTDQYRFRKGGQPTNNSNNYSPWYNVTGNTVRLLFVINSSGSTKSYYTPAGTVETIPNDDYVLWVGPSKVFGTNGTANSSNDIDDFKFLFNDGIGTIDFDNILINPIPEATTTSTPQIINAQQNPQFNALWAQSSAPTNITGYVLDVATDPAFATPVAGYDDLYVDGPFTLSQLVTGVSLLNDHHIRVRPVYQIGSNEISGAWSNVTVLSSLEFLPVELTRFTASLVNKAAELKWATSEEFNSSHFEVERSSDGRTFTKVGTVTSKNSANGSTYAYTDQLLAAGKNYYRLKMVDIDGKFEYSHVVMVSNNEAVRMNAYPNPTRDKVTVQFSKANAGATMKVVSLEGRVMNQIAVPANSTQMDVNLNGMTPGIYHLIYTNNGEQSVKRIQKL